MKMLVCISIAPDTTSKIKFKENNTKFDDAGVQAIINPYDEWYALVKAIEIKEKLGGGSVTVIIVGNQSTEGIIRKALAIGADDAKRINTEPKDAYYVANQIAKHVEKNAYDIIFTGKETIHNNGSQIGGMISGILDYPFVSYANQMEVIDNMAIVQREIQGGEEVVEITLPFVVSCAKGMAEQRIPNMRGIMEARKKSIEVLSAIESDCMTEIISYESPVEKSGVKIISADEVDKLVELLHKEAKVI